MASPIPDEIQNCTVSSTCTHGPKDRIMTEHGPQSSQLQCRPLLEGSTASGKESSATPQGFDTAGPSVRIEDCTSTTTPSNDRENADSFAGKMWSEIKKEMEQKLNALLRDGQIKGMASRAKSACAVTTLATVCNKPQTKLTPGNERDLLESREPSKGGLVHDELPDHVVPRWNVTENKDVKPARDQTAGFRADVSHQVSRPNDQLGLPSAAAHPVDFQDGNVTCCSCPGFEFRFRFVHGQPSTPFVHQVNIPGSSNASQKSSSLGNNVIVEGDREVICLDDDDDDGLTEQGRGPPVQDGAFPTVCNIQITKVGVKQQCNVTPPKCGPMANLSAGCRSKKIAPSSDDVIIISDDDDDDVIVIDDESDMESKHGSKEPETKCLVIEADVYISNGGSMNSSSNFFNSNSVTESSSMHKNEVLDVSDAVMEEKQLPLRIVDVRRISESSRSLSPDLEDVSSDVVDPLTMTTLVDRPLSEHRASDDSEEETDDYNSSVSDVRLSCRKAFRKFKKLKTSDPTLAPSPTPSHRSSPSLSLSPTPSISSPSPSFDLWDVSMSCDNGSTFKAHSSSGQPSDTRVGHHIPQKKLDLSSVKKCHLPNGVHRHLVDGISIRVPRLDCSSWTKVEDSLRHPHLLLHETGFLSLLEKEKDSSAQVFSDSLCTLINVVLDVSKFHLSAVSMINDFTTEKRKPPPSLIHKLFKLLSDADENVSCHLLIVLRKIMKFHGLGYTRDLWKYVNKSMNSITDAVGEAGAETKLKYSVPYLQLVTQSIVLDVTKDLQMLMQRSRTSSFCRLFASEFPTQQTEKIMLWIQWCITSDCDFLQFRSDILSSLLKLFCLPVSISTNPAKDAYVQAGRLFSLYEKLPSLQQRLLLLHSVPCSLVRTQLVTSLLGKSDQTLCIEKILRELFVLPLLKCGPRVRYGWRDEPERKSKTANKKLAVEELATLHCTLLDSYIDCRQGQLHLPIQDRRGLYRIPLTFRDRQWLSKLDKHLDELKIHLRNLYSCDNLLPNNIVVLVDMMKTLTIHEKNL